MARLTMEIVIGLLLSIRMCYNDACLCERGVVVFYTMEEAAVLCGFLELYLNRDSVDAAVRKNYEKFRLGLVQESLGRDDYIWATKALSFLRPHWWQDYEDQRALENALLKTQTLALKTKIYSFHRQRQSETAAAAFLKEGILSAKKNSRF